MFDKLVRWFSSKPAPQPPEKPLEQLLPNGKIALTDAKGNLLSFKGKEKPNGN